MQAIISFKTFTACLPPPPGPLLLEAREKEQLLAELQAEPPWAEGRGCFLILSSFAPQNPSSVTIGMASMYRVLFGCQACCRHQHILSR